MKRIIYTIHALKRMQERGINKEKVIICLRSPDKELVMNSEKKAIKRINNKALVVIYREIQDSIVVVTTYITSKIHKYLKE